MENIILAFCGVGISIVLMFVIFSLPFKKHTYTTPKYNKKQTVNPYSIARLEEEAKHQRWSQSKMQQEYEQKRKNQS